MTKKRDDRVKKKPTGDYPEGYCRPPRRGQIKPGEVRNPHGRNGKPKEIDGFTFAMSLPTKITLEGKPMRVPFESAVYLTHVHKALNGSDRAFATISRERTARLKRKGQDVPEPTPAEIARAAAELEEKKALSAKLVKLLEDEAARKKERGNQRDRADDDGPGGLF